MNPIAVLGIVYEAHAMSRKCLFFFNSNPQARVRVCASWGHAAGLGGVLPPGVGEELREGWRGAIHGVFTLRREFEETRGQGSRRGDGRERSPAQ